MERPCFRRSPSTWHGCIWDTRKCRAKLPEVNRSAGVRPASNSRRGRSINIRWFQLRWSCLKDGPACWCGHLRSGRCSGAKDISLRSAFVPEATNDVLTSAAHVQMCWCRNGTWHSYTSKGETLYLRGPDGSGKQSTRFGTNRRLQTGFYFKPHQLETWKRLDGASDQFSDRVYYKFIV